MCVPVGKPVHWLGFMGVVVNGDTVLSAAIDLNTADNPTKTQGNTIYGQHVHR